MLFLAPDAEIPYMLTGLVKLQNPLDGLRGLQSICIQEIDRKKKYNKMLFS